MFSEIGANNIRAKGTHFLVNNSKPIIISKTPTTCKTYPEAFKESIKSFAKPVISGNGTKCKNLFSPKTNNNTPKRILIILVNNEFMMLLFWLGIKNKYD